MSRPPADGLQAELASLSCPLYFMDFETLGPAIPRFPGMRSYDAFPSSAESLKDAGLTI